MKIKQYICCISQILVIVENYDIVYAKTTLTYKPCCYKFGNVAVSRDVYEIDPCHCRFVTDMLIARVT